MAEPYKTGSKSTVVETMTRRAWLVGGGSVAVLAALWWTQGPDARAGTFEVVKTDDEWRRLLKPEAYKVLRHEATERPYSSPLNGEKRPGTFANGRIRIYKNRGTDKAPRFTDFEYLQAGGGVASVPIT